MFLTSFSTRRSVCGAQVFELKNNKEKVHHLAWEPRGHRFALLHGEGPRPSISFFSVRDEKGRIGVRELSES